MDSLTCVMFNGNRLDESTKDALLETAYTMLQHGYERSRAGNDRFEALVTTRFKQGALSDLCGIDFFATVEYEGGKTDIRFLVNPRYLSSFAEVIEEGTWISFEDIEAIVLFDLLIEFLGASDN